MSEFSRIITLLRKEKRNYAKTGRRAAGCLAGAFVALRKGIRECGLDFVVRVADFTVSRVIICWAAARTAAV